MRTIIKRGTFDWDTGEVTLEFIDKRRTPMTLLIKQLRPLVNHFDHPETAMSTMYSFTGVTR